MPQSVERKSTRVLMFLGVFTITCFVGALFRRPLADDAYITFRYAINVLNGYGLVYNPGENVLGLSTPLWACLLAFFYALGANFEIVAQVIGVVSLCLALMLYINGDLCRALSYRVALWSVPLVFLQMFNLSTVFSGMETCTYLLVVVAALQLVARGERFGLAAFLAGIATLFRPDGVVLMGVVGLYSLLKGVPTAFRASFVFLCVYLPWVVYAWLTYGSPVPHSVAAKQVLHPSSALSNLLYISELATINPVDFVLVILGFSGLIFLLGRREYRPFVLWLVLYLTGLICSGLKPIFYWYYAPISFFLLSFGSLGVLLFLKSRNEDLSLPDKQRRMFRIAHLCYLPAIALVSCGSSLYRISQVDAAIERDNTYRAIGAEYADRVKAGDVIYVCETGVLGYAFIDNKMIDASGINSTEAYKHRGRARELLRSEGRPGANMSIETGWSLDLVQEYTPDWIISPRDWCQLRIMEDREWFATAYERLEVRYPDHLHGIAVYRRRVAQVF